MAELGVEHTDVWGWDNYKRVIRHLAARTGARRLIEIGGGRAPLFTPDALADMGAELTVNDIMPSELARLPEGYRTASFDVAGDLSSCAAQLNSFDLAFSKMVFEHVEDGEKAWRNLYALLAPGGIAIAFIPTLFALPFVVNRLLPDRPAERLIKLINPSRKEDANPVFPARYSYSFAVERWLRPMLSGIGYREVMVVPFYGHVYYRRFPVIRDLHARFTRLARRRDWRLFASYAYIIVRK